MDNYEFGEFTDIYKKRFNNVDDYLCLIAMEYDMLELCKCMLNSNKITIEHISKHICMQQEVAREIISKLLKYGCIVPAPLKQQWYVKTSIFKIYLQKVIDNKMSIMNKH